MTQLSLDSASTVRLTEPSIQSTPFSSTKRRRGGRLILGVRAVSRSRCARLPSIRLGRYVGWFVLTYPFGQPGIPPTQMGARLALKRCI